MGEHAEMVPVGSATHPRRRRRPVRLRASLGLTVAARPPLTACYGTACGSALARPTGWTVHRQVAQTFGERGALGA